MKKSVFFLMSIVLLYNCEKNKNQRNTEVLGSRVDTIKFIKTKVVEYHFFSEGGLDSIKKTRRGNYIGKGIVKKNFITFYKKNGIKQYEGFLKKGKLNGIVSYFDSNGEITGTLNYREGIQNGISLIYDTNSGFTKNILKFTEGKVNDGFVMTFNNNGTLKNLIENRKDNLYSQSVTFHKSGVIKEINSYITRKVDGKSLDGWSYYFNEKGKFERKMLFENGVEVKSSTDNR